MQGAITVLIVLILTSVGISLFKAGTKIYISGNSPFILINAKNPDTIEQTVRRALRAYPDRNIYIVNRSDSDEMRKILLLMKNDDRRIHIVGN